MFFCAHRRLRLLVAFSGIILTAYKHVAPLFYVVGWASGPTWLHPTRPDQNNDPLSA